MINLFPVSKKIIFLILILILILSALLVLKFRSPVTTNRMLPPVKVGSPEPAVNQTNQTTKNTSPTSIQTNIGTTTKEQILKLPEIASSSALTSTKTLYTFKSTETLQSHTVITVNGTVAFEKGTLIQPGLKLNKISDYLASYGAPEKTLTGSKKFGQFENTYVYATKGFALVGNPFTDEVDQLQSFIPTTVEQYISEWGQDIDQKPNIKEAF